MIFQFSLIIIISLLGLISIYFLFKYPEIAFGLFLVAGIYKGYIRSINILPSYFDLTVFFGLIVGISIIFNILINGIKIPKISSKFFIPYFILIIIMLGSLLYTQAPIYGKDKFLRFAIITTMAMFAPLFLFKDRKRLHGFFYTLIVISSIMAVNSIVNNLGIFGFHEIFYSNYISLGRINLLVCLMIIFYFIRISENITIKFGWSILFLINIFGAFSDRGRMPVIASIGTLLFLAIFSLISLLIERSPKAKKTLKTIFCILLIVFLIFIFFHKQFSALSTRMLLLTQGGGDSFLARLDLYKSSLKAFYENPIIGLGIGGFSVYYFGVDHRSYPHNMILEIGSELGILGLTSYFFLLVFCLAYLLNLRKKYIRKGKYYFFLIAILTVFIFMFLNTMASGDINDNRVFFMWFGIIYSIGRIFREEESQIYINNN